MKINKKSDFLKYENMRSRKEIKYFRKKDSHASQSNRQKIKKQGCVSTWRQSVHVLERTEAAKKKMEKKT